MLTGTYTSELSQYLIGKIKNLKDYKKRKNKFKKE